MRTSRVLGADLGSASCDALRPSATRRVMPNPEWKPEVGMAVPALKSNSVGQGLPESGSGVGLGAFFVSAYS